VKLRQHFLELVVGDTGEGSHRLADALHLARLHVAHDGRRRLLADAEEEDCRALGAAQF
jgi:hypothetical protein